jgi:Fe-S-cluster containining protein
MNDAAHPLIRNLLQVCNLADSEFARGRKVHGARILCGRGCSQCCSQVFQITEVEAARISAHVAGLPAADRATLQAAAQAYVADRARLFGGAEAWGQTAPAGAALPCPALGAEGECTIYEARPIICRKFGVPIFNPDRPERVMACELSFKPGESFADSELVSRQTALYRAQQQLQAQWNEAGGARSDAPWTIARAIIEDARNLLPKA